MQMINTITAMPNTTNQLATGNSVIDALMVHPTPSDALRVERERSRDIRGISRCLSQAIFTQPTELTQRCYLDGLQQEMVGETSKEKASWRLSSAVVTPREVKPQLVFTSTSAKSTGIQGVKTPTGTITNFGTQLEALKAFGKRRCVSKQNASKHQAFTAMYLAYSTSV